MASLSDWETFVQTRHPDAHLLQTAAWGRLKSSFGWQAEPVLAEESGALILFRALALGFSIAYLPRGPVPADPAALSGLLPQIDSLCRTHRAVFLKAEPDLADGEAAQGELRRIGFRPSPHTIQPPRTIRVDLRGSEDDLLARMKPKTRYNIRLAARHGVSALPSEDLDEFIRLMQATGARDSFAIHSGEYYRKAYAEFARNRNALLLLARLQEQTLAGLMAFTQGRRAWYLYGASSDIRREVMAPYLLQWEAMRWARSRECEEYDLWGIPDVDQAALESQFASRQDGLWGVYRFKRGYGGRIWRATGAWDRVYHPPLYRLYRLWLARRPGVLA
ncbi:MAG: peptidoglycan bridge formation glycyltransferase FemA/FemB family protein [Anaerolineales bacterium]|nr:peptidoglycan bridge formation glycyltransferase FemA/FemB family protein [Anaerolineales bacterium]